MTMTGKLRITAKWARREIEHKRWRILSMFNVIFVVDFVIMLLTFMIFQKQRFVEKSYGIEEAAWFVFILETRDKRVACYNSLSLSDVL